MAQVRYYRCLHDFTGRPRSRVSSQSCPWGWRGRQDPVEAPVGSSQTSEGLGLARQKTQQCCTPSLLPCLAHLRSPAALRPAARCQPLPGRAPRAAPGCQQARGRRPRGLRGASGGDSKPVRRASPGDARFSGKRAKYVPLCSA